MTDPQPRCAQVDGEVAVPALELVDITAGYAATEVLRGLSVRVQPGEVVAVLGPNGAGKTTMLRVAAGLIRPNCGRVQLHGDDVTRLAPHAHTRRGLCLVAEGRAVFRSLTVRENLQIFLGPRAGDLDLALDRVASAFPALKDRLDQPAGELSGGQQQMLALSRAYVSQPSLVLLDELSMGLAPLLVEQIFEAIRALAVSGVGLVVVEQYVDRAMDLANRAVLINKGTVAYDGPSSSVDRDLVLREYLGHVS